MSNRKRLARMEIVSRRTAMRLFDLEAEHLDRLEELDLLTPILRPGRERAYASSDLDQLRVYRVLIRELGVNHEGAEIILRMREQMFQIQNRMLKLIQEMRTQGMLEQVTQLFDSLQDPFRK